MPTAIEPITHREAWRIPAWLGLFLFLAIAAFFRWEEHRAHVLDALPYVLLLLCSVIHLFMHRGPAAYPRKRWRSTSLDGLPPSTLFSLLQQGT